MLNLQQHCFGACQAQERYKRCVMKRDLPRSVCCSSLRHRAYMQLTIVYCRHVRKPTERRQQRKSRQQNNRHAKTHETQQCSSDEGNGTDSCKQLLQYASSRAHSGRSQPEGACSDASPTPAAVLCMHAYGGLFCDSTCTHSHHACTIWHTTAHHRAPVGAGARLEPGPWPPGTRMHVVHACTLRARQAA